MNILSKLLIFTTLLFAVSIRPVNGQNKGRTAEIIILHTNDMHAKIDNMAKLAYFADSLRKTHKYVFLLAAGDNFTGNPVVDMVEDKGYPMIDLMNRCGFNASAMGNHEFDLGQDKLNARMKQANFPFISCNINASGARVRQPKPYKILRAGRLKIPVLAMIQLGDNGMPDSHPSKLTGLIFTDGIQKAREYAWLKDKYGILIGLTHLGVEGDEHLAKQMPQFDVIIGGHSHTTLKKPMMVDSVMIVQTGSGLKNVGKITLMVKNGRVTERKYELIPLSSVAGTDTAIQRLIDKYNDNKELDRVIAVSETPISGTNELGSLMTDAITSRLKVDFAFQNTGGIRVPSIPAGDIRLKDVYRLDPFGNLAVIYKMNLAEIKSLIANSYKRDKRIDLEVSGMSYTVLTDKDGKYSDVQMLDKSGNPLDSSKEYLVGVNSYISATYKFDHRDAGTTSYFTCSQLLIDFLGEVKKVNYSGTKRTYVKIGE